MWIITILSFLVTALCLVLLCFAVRMLAKRIHTASKKHGLAFFRDQDARRISQLLIIVMFIMGLGLEGMGIPLGSVAGSFSWWKYLLFIGLTATLIPELGTDVKTIMEEIRTSAKDIFKAIRPAEKPAPEPAINPEFNSHRPPINEMNTTNQQQPWTPKEVVDLGEFMEEAAVVEEVDEADEFAPLVEEEEGNKIDVLAAGSEKEDDKDLVDRSNFAEMADTADDVPKADDLALEEAAEDALDPNSSAEMAEDGEDPELEEAAGDVVNLSDFAGMADTAEDGEDPKLEEAAGDVVELSDFAGTADDVPAEDGKDSELEEAAGDVVELSDFAEMADDVPAEDGEDPELKEATGDVVELSDFAEMADTAEDGEDPELEEATENEPEGEDDMREFLKDFS